MHGVSTCAQSPVMHAVSTCAQNNVIHGVSTCAQSSVVHSVSTCVQNSVVHGVSTCAQSSVSTGVSTCVQSSVSFPARHCAPMGKGSCRTTVMPSPRRPSQGGRRGPLVPRALGDLFPGFIHPCLVFVLVFHLDPELLNKQQGIFPIRFGIKEYYIICIPGDLL